MTKVEAGLLKLAGETMALEMVMRVTLAAHLAAGVKNEAGYARAAEQAKDWERRLVAILRHHTRDPDDPIVSAVFKSAEATIIRCCQGAVEGMNSLGMIALDSATPPSPANH